jgi:hypothetical protein
MLISVVLPVRNQITPGTVGVKPSLAGMRRLEGCFHRVFVVTAYIRLVTSALTRTPGCNFAGLC